MILEETLAIAVHRPMLWHVKCHI